MLDYLRKRPMLISAVGCTFSAVCGFYSVKALWGYIVTVLGCFLFFLKRKNRNLSVAAVLILIMSLSCLVTLNKIQDFNENNNRVISSEICSVGTVYKSEVYYRTDFEIVSSTTLPKGTRLSLWHSPLKLAQGELIKAKIKLQEIDKDYKASNYSNGIYISGNILGIELLHKNDRVLGFTENIRSYIKNIFFDNMSYESVATMCALVFGDRGYFTDEFYENVKASGVAHAMVVSGMHLSIIVSLVLRITEKLFYNRIFKAVAMLLTVVAVCGVCGFTASILRSGVTFVIMAAGILISRSYSSENALGAAVTFISVFSPFAILNIGFQLSVLSTFGILAVALPLCDYLGKFVLPKAIRWVIESAIFSLSAMLLTLPVLINTFGTVSTVAVVTNLLITIPLDCCLIVAVITVISSMVFPVFSSAVLRGMDFIVMYINFVINHLGSFKYSVLRVDEWGVYASVLLIIFLFGIMLACKNKRNMVKLKKLRENILKERGSGKKWQLFLRKH